MAFRLSGEEGAQEEEEGGRIMSTESPTFPKQRIVVKRSGSKVAERGVTAEQEKEKGANKK